jgi:hypothetical protein
MTPEQIEQTPGQCEPLYGSCALLSGHRGTGDDGLMPYLPMPHPHQRATYGTLAYKARQACQNNAEKGAVTYADIFLEEVGEALAEHSPARLREELIQVAAVAVAWVEKINRDLRRVTRSGADS